MAQLGLLGMIVLDCRLVWLAMRWDDLLLLGWSRDDLPARDMLVWSKNVAVSALSLVALTLLTAALVAVHLARVRRLPRHRPLRRSPLGVAWLGVGAIAVVLTVLAAVPVAALLRGAHLQLGTLVDTGALVQGDRFKHLHALADAALAFQMVAAALTMAVIGASTRSARAASVSAPTAASTATPAATALAD